MVAAATAVWLATLISHGHHGGDGDAAHYLIITHSLAFDGDLDLTNDYGPGTHLVFEGTLEPGSHAHVRESALRPVHDVGLPLIAAPFFRVTYELADRLATSLSPEVMRRTKMTPSIVFRHFVSLQMIAVAVVLGLWLFALFNESCPGHERTAAFVAVVAVLSPPILPLAFSFFTELPSAVVALGACQIIRRHPRPRPVIAFAVGALASFLILLHIRNVGLAAARVAPLAIRRTGVAYRAGGWNPDAARDPRDVHVLDVGTLALDAPRPSRWCVRSVDLRRACRGDASSRWTAV